MAVGSWLLAFGNGPRPKLGMPRSGGVPPADSPLNYLRGIRAGGVQLGPAAEEGVEQAVGRVADEGGSGDRTVGPSLRSG